ncbi:MAG: hypothetical protein Q9200_001578 [Gallowayella weberi]
MSTLDIPIAFQRSYENYETYPRNIIHQPSYFGTLEAHADHFEEAASTFLVASEKEAFVPIRDLRSNGQEPVKRNILDDYALKEWLGDQSSIDPVTSTRLGAVATKTDPKCRFIFISAGNSREPLKISRRMLTRILTYHQVMPCYLEFVSVFRLSKYARELRFSGFREQVALHDHAVSSAVPSLGRSGRQIQLCYNLKGVARITTEKTLLWSIRQAAFHHQFDVITGNTVWIVTKGNLDIKKKIQALTGQNGRVEDRSFETPEQCLRSSLAVHLLHCHWSMENWRWYVQFLEDQVDHETDIAVHGPRERGEAVRAYSLTDLQNLQHYQDKINETIMVLEGNNEVLSSLGGFYRALLGNSAFLVRDACHEDISSFAKQVDEMIHDSSTQISRAKLLVRITSDRKDLVSQHLQSQTTQKMEDLTESMHKIGVASQKEAIIMRIITAVTLIYLPGTFVSTLFSTDVVRFHDGKEAFSKMALHRWLEVTFPLTTVTLFVAFLVFEFADKKRRIALSVFQDVEPGTLQSSVDDRVFLKG